jgi:hypothetical protein
MTPFVAFMKDIAEMTRQFVLDQTRPLEQRLLVLEAENKALSTLVVALTERTKGVMRARGVWSSTEVYQPGDCVVWRYQSWAATEDSVGYAPGGGNGKWQLLAARGRDGRDAAA